MPRISPTLEGFRAAFRRPSLTLAEISWRWAVGATTTALVAFSLLEYLDTLPVTGSDILLLRTRQPILIGQALGHIFHGSAPRIVMAELVAAIALICLWIFAAAMGRATTVRSLIDYFSERQKSTVFGEEFVPITDPAVAPQKGPNPADAQREIDQGLNLLNQVRAVVQDSPEAKQQLQSLIEQMRHLDPKRFPGNPTLVEQMHQQLVSTLDALELQLRRQLEENRGGTIRNADPNKVPAGYQNSVAEYYRKLSGGTR